LNRLDNWQANLRDVIRARKEADFGWGRNDCTQFALDAIQAVVGVDHGEGNRDRYTTPRGALKMLKKGYGVDTCEGLIAKFYGERKPIAFARKGDIVVADDPASVGLDVPGGSEVFGPLVGVCYGHLSFFVGSYGLVWVETLACSGCYHILKREAE
jgi:hypothetical protein